MTTAYTALLGLALPVQGELSGTWGTTVNDSITSLLDSAVAGTTTLSTDADVTLTTTTGAANTSREAILLFSGARTALRTITAPAASKIYTVINATTGGFGVKLVGVGPTTGLTIPAGASAVVAWNGSDFVEIGATTLGNMTVTGSLTLTAGTANGVAYLNGSKVLTTGTALVFDGANLGINTTPSVWSTNYRAIETSSGSLSGQSGAVLRLMQNAYVNTSSNFTYVSTAATSIYQQDSGIHSWFTNTSGTAATQFSPSEKMRLDLAGNLGLGVTPSAWTSHTALQIGARTALSDDSTATQLNNNSYYNSGWIYKQTAAATMYQALAGVHSWYTAPSGTAGNAITFTQAMTLDASGNLGIGTSSPSFKLQVVGGSTAASFSPSTATDSALIKFNNAGTGDFFIGKDNSSGNAFGSGSAYSANFYNGANTPMLFWTNAAEQMRLDASGRLLVGLTATGAYTDGQFSSTAASARPASTLKTIDTPTQSTQFIWNATDSGTRSFQSFLLGSSPTIVGSITSTGSVTLYNASSDYRLKNITGPVTGDEAKTFVMALKPKQGSWKADGSKFVGFIAHEFQEVAPDSVSGTKDAVDKDGKPIIQSMQASSAEVIANLVAHIQNLEQRLAALEAK